MKNLAGEMFRVEVVSRRGSGPAPFRAGSLELLRMAKGRAIWSLEDQVYPMKEGDVLLVLPGEIFGGFEAPDAVAIRVERLILPVGREAGLPLAEGLREATGMDGKSCTLLAAALTDAVERRVSFGDDGGRWFGELMGEPSVSLRRAGLEYLHARAALVKLLARLALEFRNPAPVSDGSGEAEERLTNFLAQLERRCAEPWTLDQMAAETGLRRTRFGMLCRQATGESPSVFLNRLRIRRSRRLLRETERSITDIAFDCGFSSSQYFARIFRRYQGHEPSHYRALSREIRQGKAIRYLKGDSARIMALSTVPVGAGDFVVEGRVTLDRLGGTAASVELGPDRFGFDGRSGCLFLEGKTFGEAQFFDRSSLHIREGVPFDFIVRRRGARLAFGINGQPVAEVDDSPARAPGAVGLRPMRNGIHIHSFRVNGEDVEILPVGGDAG